MGRTDPLLGSGEAQAPGEATAVAEALAWELLQDLQQPQTDSLVASSPLRHLSALLCTPDRSPYVQPDMEALPSSLSKLSDVCHFWLGTPRC